MQIDLMKPQLSNGLYPPLKFIFKTIFYYRGLFGLLGPGAGRYLIADPYMIYLYEHAGIIST